MIMTPSLSALVRDHGAVMSGEGGLPLHFGDLRPEVAALESGTGVLDLEACGVILLRGPQAAQFLNGLTTNDAVKLAVGAIQPSLISANKGKILFEILLLRTKAEEFLLLTEPGELEAVAGHLNFYHVREELEFGQVPLVRLDLIGPGAGEALRFDSLSDRDMTGRFSGDPLVTVPVGLGELNRIIALTTPAAAAGVAQSILQNSPGSRLVGLEAFDEVRIRQGVPRMGADFDRDFLPAEAGLYTHLSFNKGCYVGQEVHARMQHRGHPNRKLVALSWPESEPAGEAGAELFHAGEVAGRMTSVTRLSHAGRWHAIALVRFALTHPPTPLSLRAGGEAAVAMRPLATDLGSRRP